LTFKNIPFGSLIVIYTVSGEKVLQIEAKTNSVLWDGKTTSNNKVSSGIYIYLIIKDAKVIKKDKLFIIRK